MTENPGEDSTTARQLAESEQMDQVIGRLLQFGVLGAAIVVLVGGLALLVQHGGARTTFETFNGEKNGYTTFAAIFRGVAARDAGAITQLGLVLLIATPVARVALTLGAFIFQKDRLYIAVTTLVLALLLYGLFWSGG